MTFGGDGIDHYPGGVANCDILNGSPFGSAGAMTTDTTDTAGIRLGTVIGTLSASPSRADWFLVGSGTSDVVPGGSGHLYGAVNDTFYSNNTGSYDVTVEAIPEPATLSLAPVGLASLACSRYRGQKA